MKKIIITSVLALLLGSTQAQINDIYVIDNPNPALKEYNSWYMGADYQKRYNTIVGSGDWKNLISSAKLGENSAIGVDINTYKVGLVSENQYWAKYAYSIKLDEDKWRINMGLGIAWDEYIKDYSEADWLNPIGNKNHQERYKGSSAMAGFVITNNRTFISLYGERVILGFDDVQALDNNSTMNMRFDFAQRFTVIPGQDKETLSMRTGISTDFTSFDMFKDLKTLPITLDISARIFEIVDIGVVGNNNTAKLKIMLSVDWFNVFYTRKIDYGTSMITYPTQQIGIVIVWPKKNHEVKTGGPMPHLPNDDDDDKEGGEG